MMLLFPRVAVFPWLAVLFATALSLPLSQASAEGTVPTTSPRAVRVLRDQAYTTGANPLLCDVYLPGSLDEATDQGSPERAIEAKRPVVILIHGGGWMTGSKWTMQPHAMMLAEQGVAAVSINYRLAPTHPFPSQVDDVRQAYAWVVSQSERWNLDATRIALYGYSAGAHLACMIGTLADEPLETQQATSLLPSDHPLLSKPVRPIAIVGGGTPCDFQNVPAESAMFSYFLKGTRHQYPELYRLASPLALVSANDVPVFLYHGTEDSMVPFEPCDQFCQAHRKLQLDTQLLRIEKQGHLLTFIDEKARRSATQYLVNVLTRPSAQPSASP